MTICLSVRKGRINAAVTSFFSFFLLSEAEIRSAHPPFDRGDFFFSFSLFHLFCTDVICDSKAAQRCQIRFPFLSFFSPKSLCLQRFPAVTALWILGSRVFFISFFRFFRNGKYGIIYASCKASGKKSLMPRAIRSTRLSHTIFSFFSLFLPQGTLNESVSCAINGSGREQHQQLFIFYDRPLVGTICSGSHYSPTAISTHIL